MKKNLLMMAAVMFGILIAFASCNNKKSSKSSDDEDEDEKELVDERDKEQAVQKLRDDIRMANTQCPVSLGILGEITSITYEDGLLLFSYEINEDIFNIATLSEDRRAMKENLKTMLSNPQGQVRNLMQMVIDADSKMKVTMRGKTTDAVASVTLNASELEELMDAEVSPHEKLVMSINSTQPQLPLDADVGMKITELFLEGSDVVYVIKCDDSMYDISAFRENESLVRSTMLNNISNMGPVERGFIKLVVDDDANLVYRYTLRSGHLDIKITNAELRSYL